LKTYLYDTYTANKDKIKSTGNAYRRSISSSPIPWVTNLIVTPGMQSLDSIIKDVKRGILVYSTIGYWLSNPISGQLSATVTHGYLIENGEVKHPIKGIVISDDFYELMKSRVIQLSKEVENYMGIYAPHIHLRNVQVAGD
ncbi:MAG: TldD/PmbA family protein, partial [Thermoprotei archaeon]